MAQPAFAYPQRRLTLATEPHPGPEPVFGALPSDWTVLPGSEIGALIVDAVILGPNGVFTVVEDPDLRPAALTPDGLYRAGSRVTTSVKRALAASFTLRRHLAEELPTVFPYPLLALHGHTDMGFVGRLRVLPADMVAEAVWTHPGRPLLRSERRAVARALAG
jgi:hypothetical protein